MNHPRLLVLLMLALFVSTIVVASNVSDDEPESTDSPPWIRIVEDNERIVRLDIAARTLIPKDGDEPTITLVGAVHIGERRYYERLQAFLDDFDIVLYEGVNPAGSGLLPPDLGSRQRIDRTRSRQRLLAILLERHRSEHDAYPVSLEELAASLEEHRRQARWLEDARLDAWSNPIGYSLSDDGSFELTSLGADSEFGGSGPDADILFSEQDPLSEAELGVAPGIQQRLARTFRLRFQLDEMDETKPNWRNADMDVDQLQERLGGGDDEGDGIALFDLLDGSSGIARLASAVLTMIEALPGAAPRGRLMIMEMLSVADESMLAASMPGGDQIIDVIIGDRNQVVVDDLRTILEDEPRHRRIAVLYGAGHMPDLERRIVEQLDYRPSGETIWNTAMRLPLDRFNITPQERIMLRASLLKQLKDLKRMRGR